MSSGVTPSASVDVNSDMTRRVAHGDLHDGDTGVIFEIAIDGRHIVAELVQLTNGIVNGMEVEVRGDVIGILVVCGVLHRAEIVDLFALWHDDHAARVLARGAFDARAGNGKAFFLRAGKHTGTFFGILFHVAERGFIRDGCDGAGLEDVFRGRTASPYSGAHRFGIRRRS